MTMQASDFFYLDGKFYTLIDVDSSNTTETARSLL